MGLFGRGDVTELGPKTECVETVVAKVRQVQPKRQWCTEERIAACCPISSNSSLSSFTAYAAAAPPATSRAILNVAGILSAADDALANYARALDEWHTMLRGLQQLEEEVGNIMRDREILVTRLIKASNKSSSSSKPSSPNLRRFSASSPSVNLQNQSPIRSIPTSTKLAAAQTELQACETHLAAKEKELSHRRFQVIRDGLTLRGRALADTGRAWTDLGLETLTVLERELGLARPGLQLDKPLPHRESPEASSYQHHSPSPSIHSHPQQHLGHRPFPGSFEHFDSSESRLSSPSPYRRRNSIHIPAAHAIHSEIDVPIPIMSSNNTSPPASTVEVQNSRQRGSSRPQSFSGAATNMQRPQGQARSHLTTPALQQQQRVSMASTVSDDNEVWADASDGEHRGIHSETNSTTSHSHSHNPLPRQLSDIRERSSSAHGHEAHYPTEESAPPPISSIGAGAPFGGLAHEQLRSHSPLHHVSDTPSRPSSSRHSSAPAIPLAIPTAPGSIFHSEEYRSFRESSYGTPQVNGVSKSRSEASSGSSHIRGAAANAHNDRTGASTPDSVSEGEVYTGTRVRLGSVSAGSSEQQPPSHALPQSQGIAGNPMLEALARETDRQRSTETLSTPQSPATLHARAARRSSIAVAVDSSGNIREIHVHEGTSSAVQSPSQGVAAPAATSPKEPTFEFQSPPAKLYEGAIVDPRMVGGHGLHRHDREDEVEIPTVSQSPSPLDEGEGEGTPAVPSIATATGGGTSGIGVSGLGQLVASTSSGTVQPETPSKLSKTQRKKMKRREKERAKAQQTAAAEQDRSDISGAETETTKAGTFVSSTVESSGAPTQTAGAAEKQDEGVRRPGDVSTTEDEGEVERLVQSGGYTVVENRRFSGGARELERAKTVVVPSYAAAGLPPAGVKVPVATPARSATLPASTTVPPASTTAPTAAAAAPPALSEAPVIQTQAAPTAQNFGHKVKAAFVAPVGGPLVQVGQRKAPPVEAEPKPAEDVSTPGDAITSTTTGVPTVPTTTTATTTAAPATTTAISATAPTTAATTTTTTTTLATPAVPLAIADQRLPPPSTAPPAGSTGITPSPSKKEEKRGSFFGRLFGRGRSASAKGPSAPVESVHEVAAPAPAAPVEGAVGATRPVEVPPVQGTTAVVVEGTTQVAQPAVVVEETAQAAQPVVTVEEPPRESVQTPVGGAVPLSAEAEPALPPPIPVSPQVTDHDVVPAATTVQEQPLTQVHVREIHEVVQGGEVVERTEEERVQDVPVAVGQSSSAVVAAVEADDHIVQTVHAERPVLVTLSATRGSEQPIIVQPLQQQPEPVTQEQVLQPTTQVQVAQPTTQVQFAQPTAQAQVPQSTVQPQVSQQQPPAQQAAPPPAEAVPTEPRLHQVSEEATTTPAKLSKKDRKAEKERQKAAEKEQKEREKAAEREQKEREKAAERERKERERMERERTRPEGSPSKHQQGHGFLGGLKGFFGADLAEGGGTPSRREMRGLAGGASGGGSQAMPPVHPEAYTSTEGATTTWVPSSHPALQATTPSHSVHTTPTNTAERAKVQESPSKRGGLAALFGRGHARSASTTDVGLPFSSSLLGEDASDENAARRYIVVENKLDFSSRLASSPPATSTPPKVRSKGGMERRQVGGISPSKRTTLPAAQYHPPPVEDSSPFAIAHAPAPLDIEQLQAQARSQLVSGHSRSQSSAAALGGGGWTTRTDKNLKRLSKGGEGWDSDGGEMRGFISNVGGGTARIEPAYEPVVIRDDPMPLRPVDGMKRKHVSATQSIPLASSSMTNIPASASVPVTDLDRAASPASGPARKLRKANKGGAVPVATSTPPMAVPQAPPIPSTREVHHSQIARGAHMPPVPQAPPAASTSTAVPFPEPVPAEHRSGYGSDDGGTINRKKSLGGQQKTRRTTSMSVPPSGVTYGATVLPAGGEQPSGQLTSGGWDAAHGRQTSAPVKRTTHPPLGQGLPPSTALRTSLHSQLTTRTHDPSITHVRKQQVDNRAHPMPIPSVRGATAGIASIPVPRAPPPVVADQQRGQSLLSLVEDIAARNRRGEEQMRILRGRDVMDLEVPQAPPRVYREDLEGPGDMHVTPPKQTVHTRGGSSTTPARQPSTSRPARSPLKSALKSRDQTPSPLPSTYGLPKNSLPQPKGGTDADGGYYVEIDEVVENGEVVTRRVRRVSKPTSPGRRASSVPAVAQGTSVRPLPVSHNNVVQSTPPLPSSNPAATSDGPQRRKSVRVSLQPTFSPSPPPISPVDTRFHPTATPPLPPLPPAPTSNGGPSKKRMSARKIKDIWQNSSDEDEEYAKAKSLLSRASMERATLSATAN